MNHDNFTEVTSADAPRMTNLPAAIAWAAGYNACLERTNAAELLECLIEAKDKLKEKLLEKCISMNLSNEETENALENSYLIKKITNAIKKATDERG